MNKITMIVILLCIAMTGNAQEIFVTPREVATQLNVGAANSLDTYLSPEKYRGLELRFNSDVMRNSTKRQLTYSLSHEGALGYLHNRVGNAHELCGHYAFAYGVMYRWQLMDDRLRIMAGGMAEGSIGFAYNTRTSANNPAQAYVSMDIGPQVAAQYRFRLFNRVFRVSYSARVPLVGLMFSPNYGQSYYEIFDRGNYDRNIVPVTIATFQMRQQVALDIPVGKRTAIRVGYLGDIRQTKPNGLRQHHYYNAGTIGVVVCK